MPTRRDILSAPMVFAAPAKQPLSRNDLPTPALIVEADALDANIAKMAKSLKAANRDFRPHGKTHKCPAVAKACIAAGAAGACAAKLSEAEVFAEHGVTGILVTTAVVGAPKISRAVRLAKRSPDTIFSVDDLANVRQLNEAAAAENVILNVAIDLWVGRRTGILPGEPAAELAKQIAGLKNLKLKGLQAYAGHSSHTKGFDERVKSSKSAMAPAVETRRLIEAAGIPCSWLSGGSTGTWNIDAAIEGVTEHQPGSFLFMDTDYARIGGQGGEVFDDFQTSLFVISTVVSKPKPDLAIVDGGFKAFATDRGYGAEARSLKDVTYRFAGDEHGALELKGANVKVGDRIEFIVPHCDPTVNLYDTLYAVRGDRVTAAWPIAARGMSQ